MASIQTNPATTTQISSSPEGTAAHSGLGKLLDVDDYNNQVINGLATIASNLKINIMVADPQKKISTDSSGLSNSPTDVINAIKLIISKHTRVYSRGNPIDYAEIARSLSNSSQLQNLHIQSK